MERRYVCNSLATCEIQQRQSAGSGKTVVGYGAIFFDGTPGSQYELWPGCYERITPGAFDAVITQDVAGLFNHDPSMILGRTSAGTMRLVADSRGLRYEIALPDSPIGQNVGIALQRGDLRGSSFSFNIDEGGELWSVENGVAIRTITRVAKLFDCGPVTFPAYEGTSASASDGEPARSSYAAWITSDEARRRRRVRAEYVALLARGLPQ